LQICKAEESTSAGSPIEEIPVTIDIPSLKKIDECLQKQPLLEDLIKKQAETIEKLQSTLSDTKRELDLERRENEINQKILELKDKEIAGLNRNFEQMKEVADRAIKLAETAKPQSNWQLMGILGMAAFAIGMIVGK
jgi:predicted RNase H-like nuclease (RuvC/YqgF family)